MTDTFSNDFDRSFHPEYIIEINVLIDMERQILILLFFQFFSSHKWITIHCQTVFSIEIIGQQLF